MPEIKIKMNQVGESTSEAVIRDHKLLIDRPAAKGGQDKGPMGGEYLLAALGGCFNSNLLAAIKAREADIKNVSMDITGVLDGEPVVFKKITVEVGADHQDDHLFNKLVTIADRACISSNTLKGAGVEVEFKTV